jgi:hypothetical protein
MLGVLVSPASGSSLSLRVTAKLPSPYAAAVTARVNRPATQVGGISCTLKTPDGSTTATNCGSGTRSKPRTTAWRISLTNLDVGDHTFTAVVSMKDGRTVTEAARFTVKPVAICKVTPYNAGYDGQAHTATGSCTGAGGVALPSSYLTLSRTTHRKVGTYPRDRWSFSDPTGFYPAHAGRVKDVIRKGDQTITFDAGLGTVEIGGTYAPSAASSSGLPVTFSIAGVSAGVCSLAGGVVSLNAAGDCTINADQAGDPSWKPAPQAQLTVTVPRRTQSITFGSGPDDPAVGGYYTPSATASSGLPVTFSIDPSTASQCSIVGGVVFFEAAGDCTVNADQAGNGTYDPAPRAQQTFTIRKLGQTISFGAPPADPRVSFSYTPSATATSGLTVEFSIDSASLSVCSVDAADGSVRFDAAGVCTVNASQPGNGTYAAAPGVQQTFTIQRRTQSISFISTPTGLTVGGTYNPVAVATSGLPVTLSVDTASALICSISGNTVSFVAIGLCKVNADQPGNGTYLPAATVQQSFTISAPLLKPSRSR